MKHKFYITSLTLLLYHTVTSFIKNDYSIEVDEVELCPNNDKLAMPIRNLKFSSYNRTQKVLNYDFTYDRPIDKNVGGSIVVERWGDGGWKPVPFIGYQPDVCKTMNNFFKNSWVSAHKSAGVTHPDRCPIPPGNYSMRNYVVDTSDIHIPFWSGRFRLNVMYVDAKTRETIFCYCYHLRVNEMV